MGLPEGSDATITVERYLTAVADHDWGAASGYLAGDVVRIGPYGDTYAGAEAYLSFLSQLMPTLPGYAMVIRRVVASGSVVTAELSETVEFDGVPTVTAESLVFDLDEAGRITRIAVYIQKQPHRRTTDA